VKEATSNRAHLSIREVVDFKHMDYMSHLGPFLRIRIHAPQCDQESLLQRLGGRLLRQLRVEDGLVVPVGHLVLEPFYKVYL